MPPKEIWIAGQRCEVIMEDLGFLSGLCSICDGIIKLNSCCQSIEFLRETLLHEVIHAIDRAMLDPSLTRELCSPAKQNEYRLTEPQVLAFSRGLWMTLTDPRNAGAVAWMLGPVLPG